MKVRMAIHKCCFFPVKRIESHPHMFNAVFGCLREAKTIQYSKPVIKTITNRTKPAAIGRDRDS